MDAIIVGLIFVVAVYFIYKKCKGIAQGKGGCGCSAGGCGSKGKSSSVENKPEQ